MSIPVTRVSILLQVLCWSFSGMAQNCPKFDSCPNNIVTLCDETNNDPVFWNAPPFTEYPGLTSGDLPEASDVLSISTKPGACPGAFTIKFALFLDLNGDNLLESVIASDQSLPAGRMLFGNALNPGWSGMDTISFDNRPVPDSVKFRFTLETTDQNGTLTAVLRWHTASDSNVYIAPRLPHGRHLIRWTIEKNGVMQDVCETVFRVKDCLAPELTCFSDWNPPMPANDTLVLQATDFVEFASDNITPDSLLQFSLRRAGTGTGFPVGANGQPVEQLTYTCPDLGYQAIELWVRDLSGNVNSCTAAVTVFDPAGHCIPDAPRVVCATTIYADHDTMRHVQYTLNTQVEQGLPPLQLTVTRLADGCVQLPDFSPYLIEEVAIIPSKNDDPLNGVSTFDLVLINRHILGTQLFNKNWQFLAADANSSATLTTYDIIELRKLILGIYDSLPSCRSWRFMQANCQLDSLHPLQSVCPGVIGFSPAHIPSELTFWAVKTGDVSGNADPDSLATMPEDRYTLALQLPDVDIRAGETIELPLSPAAPAEWSACQWAMQWDPDVLSLQAVSPGALPEFATAEPRPGVLTYAWFADTARWIFPEEPLCTLRLRAKTAVRLSEAIRFLPSRLQPVAYDQDGDDTALNLEFIPSASIVKNTAVFPPQPNPAPAGTGVRFPVHLSEPGMVRLDVFNATGEHIFQTELNVASGAGAIEWPAGAGTSAPGVFSWRVQAGRVSGSGKLVRL